MLLLLAPLAVHVLFAQQRLSLPAQQEPGKPVRLVLPEALAGQEGGTVVVTPGPEPWYTVFATGEVVGYIEPCG